MRFYALFDLITICVMLEILFVITSLQGTTWQFLKLRAANV